MTPKLTPQQFVSNWSNVRLKESASYVTHFDDLCDLVGHAKPAHMDKTGEVFTYQKGALKSEGGEIIGHGFADVWYKDRFAVEYKGAGRHKTLTEAFKQLQQYCGALENPPLLVVCDIEHYEVHTNFNGAVTKVYRFTNADVASAKEVPGSPFNAYQILHHLFHDPAALRPHDTTADVTTKAARQFAELSESIHKKNPRLEPLHVARFLVKIVFCLFCEDVGLLPKDVFARIVAKTIDSPAKFTRSLRDLFKAMAAGGDVWGEDILHFDGGLFYANDDEQDVIGLDGEDARRVLDAAKLNWADIDPSIFGSLFERALDIEGRRAELGAHYTSRADIETIVEPVLMLPLRRAWGEIKLSAAKLAASGKPKASIKKALSKFLDQLAALKVLDPACGSGNFLYVSLTLLKDLEQEVIAFAANLGLDDFQPRISPAQLYGIEKDDFAHELSSIVVWIGYLQWKMKNGYEPAGETPILKPLNNIQHMDAILTLTPALSLTPQTERGLRGRGSHPSPSEGEGTGMRVAEPAWPACDVIVGNPPFLGGGGKMRAALGDSYVDAIFALYGDRIPNTSDLCCYWFEKARAMIADDKVKRVGLLATQGIRGGANREVLKRIKEMGEIFWAQSDRNWIQDGVAVHVSMIGFDNGTEQARTLDNVSVNLINTDLTTSLNLTAACQLLENQSISFRGNTKGGAFDIDANTATYMLKAPLNPNHRPNSDVVRPWVNGQDVTQRASGRWIIDFGMMSREEAALYEAPFEYVKRVVKPERQKSRSTITDWWRHERPRVEMRKALEGVKRFIATPAVSKHRIFVWLEHPTLPDQQLIVIAREDDYMFGMLHSRVHETWTRSMGSQLREAESGQRYTPTTTFETFPFPWPPGKEPKNDPRVKAIARAAKELNDLRENWLNPYKDQPSAIHEDLKKRTLTNLYNENPTWLQLAHQKLDHAVLDAYGWPHDISDDEILARLLAENLKREPAG